MRWTDKLKMDPRDLERAFIAFATGAGVDLQHAPAETGLRCMLHFYAQQRANGCRLDEDGDMLLFQWGVYDWGAGPMFEIDVTRQVILPDEVDDDAIWQLNLTYRYAPTAALSAIAAANLWCHSPVELPVFEEYIRASPAVATAAGLMPTEVRVHFGCAGQLG